MNVLSLFDGMSCGQVALNRAGIGYKNYYASEIDKYAIDVAKKNYQNILHVGDITRWKDWDIEKPDLIIGGSPCQGFSFAGKQLNFNDERSKLFFEFVEILKHYKPKYFLLENVKMKKEYQDIISGLLGVEPIEINSALVSAQNRKRLYWTNIPGVCQPQDKGIFLKDILEEPGVIGRTVGRRIGEDGKRKDYDYSIKPEQRFEPRTDNKSGALTTVLKDNTVGVIKNKGVWKSKNDKSQCLDANYFKGVDNHGQRTMVGYVEHTNFSGLKTKHYEKSCALRAGASANYQQVNSYRKLLPIECERLQTVPENYTAHVSDTQRYKMLGNGWTVDVIAHIFSYLPGET